MNMLSAVWCIVNIKGQTSQGCQNTKTQATAQGAGMASAVQGVNSNNSATSNVFNGRFKELEGHIFDCSNATKIEKVSRNVPNTS